MPDTPSPRSRWLVPLVLVALIALLPLELIPVFQPWGARARELWTELPNLHNPLLDSLQQYYPRRVYMREALGGGWLPLWNPYAYGGTPFAGSQQGAVLYPPAWVLSVLAPELQFGWSALLHLSLAALGTYLFLRQLRLRAVSSAVGAVAFALNGFIVVWLAYPNVTQWTLCWLPLALYCWERARTRDYDLRWIAASGGVLALALLGGHGQSSMYVLLAWGAWAVFRWFTTSRNPGALLRAVVLPGALCVMLALGHLLPTLDYVPRTDRSARVSWESVQQAAMPPSQLWTFLLPRLFGDNTSQFAQEFWLPVKDQQRLTYIERSFYPGVSVLVLGGAALPLLLRRRRVRTDTAGGCDDLQTHRGLALFSVVLTLAAVLLALGTPLYWPFWKLVPGFGQFTAVARVIGLAAWSLACLAALGVEAITQSDGAMRKGAARAVTASAVVGVLLVLAAHYVFGGAAPEGVRQYLCASGKPTPDALALGELLVAIAAMATPAILGLLATRGTGRDNASPGITAPMVQWLALVVVAADLFIFGARYNPATDPKLLHVATPELTFLQDRRSQEPFRFLAAGPPGQEIDVRRRLPSNLPATYGLADIDGSDSFVPMRYREWERATRDSAGAASPWTRFASPNLRSAAVRYYLTSRPEVPSQMRGVVGTTVQEDPQALPYARVHANEDLLTALSHSYRLPLVAMTLGPDAPNFNGPATITRFQTTRVNGNRLLLRGTTTRPGLLVVAEQFDPGWRAVVDGKRARIYPADHLLVGVPLEAGEPQVDLTYSPDSFRVGTFGTLLGLAVFCALVFGWVRRRQLQL
jgi:hypothetical protein